MKDDSLIIDVRGQLPWQKRCFSNTTTLLMWVCWLFLWQPVMNDIGVLNTQSDRLVDQIINAFFNILEHGFVALLICSVMLWIWSHYIPSKTAKVIEAKTMHDYATEFGVDEMQIETARHQKIVTVYHDQSGKIVDIHSSQMV